jgi:hypothetical protein
MAAPTATVSDLERRLQATRAAYREKLAALSALLSGHSSSVVESLLGHADEFGIDHTIAVLTQSPQTFNLLPTHGLPIAHVANLVGALTDLNNDMGDLLGTRENLLGRYTLAQGRVFNINGREATVDLATHSLRYADRTRELLTVRVVEPRAPEPTPTPSAVPRRRRSRQR